jgi:hypothetical protein
LKRIIIFNRRALKIQTIFVVEEKFYFSAEWSKSENWNKNSLNSLPS